MSKKRKIKRGAEYINGLSVYHDEKRTVYKPFFSKTGYVMTDDNCAEYNRYSGCYVISLLVFTILYVFTKNFLPSLLLALAYVIVSIIVFYIRFISKAPKIENYKLSTKDNYFIRQAKDLSYSRIWTIILGCIALFICLYIYGEWSKFTGASYYTNLFCGICALIYSAINIYVLIIKKKNNYPNPEE